nr:hypothetical protein [Tanacetum cinerariifolium]
MCIDLPPHNMATKAAQNNTELFLVELDVGFTEMLFAMYINGMMIKNERCFREFVPFVSATRNKSHLTNIGGENSRRKPIYGFQPHLGWVKERSRKGQNHIKTGQKREATTSSPNHHTSNIEDAFSSNFLDYTTASPNYFLASPGNISLDPPDNLSKYLFASLAILPFHNVQAYNAVANKPPIPPQDLITPPTILTSSPILPPSPLFDPQHFFVHEELLPPKKKIYPPSSSSSRLSNSSRKQAYILVLPSFSAYTPTPPQIYELGKSSIKMCVKYNEEQVESILSYLEELSFHCIKKMEERLVDGWIIIPRDFDEMPLKRTLISEAPAMTQAAIRKLVASNVATALETQAATMANTNNPDRNSGLRRTHIARKCTYEKFMSCQPFYFNGMEGAVGLIRWLKQTELPIGVKEAYKITWSEFKRLLMKKYCPQTKIKKMEEAITMTQKLIEQLLELMLSKRLKKNTKCVNAASEELTAAKHKLMLLVYCC